MTGPNRALFTIVAAGVGGLGLWLAGHFDIAGTGGYWAAMGIVAGAGLLLGAAQIRGRDRHPAMALAFLVTLVVGGWVLIAGQPDPNWFRTHVRAWSADVGILDVVHYLLFYAPVIAFGIGVVFGYMLEPMRRPVTIVESAPVVTAPPVAVAPTQPAEPAAADEPTLAERREAAAEEAAAERARGERVTTTTP